MQMYGAGTGTIDLEIAISYLRYIRLKIAFLSAEMAMMIQNMGG